MPMPARNKTPRSSCSESNAMTVHAVERTTSGPVPLLARETGPSEPSNRRLPEPTTPTFRREGGAAVEDIVSPPRDTSARDRATDLMRATVPLPYLVGVISIALAIAAALWTIRTDVQLINQRLDFEARLREADKENVNLIFKTLEAKIESAGLRNSAMLLSQELVKKGR